MLVCYLLIIRSDMLSAFLTRFIPRSFPPCFYPHPLPIPTYVCVYFISITLSPSKQFHKYTTNINVRTCERFQYLKEDAAQSKKSYEDKFQSKVRTVRYMRCTALFQIHHDDVNVQL